MPDRMIRQSAGLLRVAAMTAIVGVAYAALLHGGGLPAAAMAKSPAVGCETAGLTLPSGFCATIFADKLGHARHMTVASDGTVYVNTWSGSYYRNGSPPPPGGFLVALRDADGDGRAEVVTRFGPGEAEGNAGGTGVALYNGGLFAETNDKIIRYSLAPGAMTPTAPATVVLDGMPLRGSHPMHPFAIDSAGALFVNSGSPSNACQSKDRQLSSMGKDPCEELATRAGIWRYKADSIDQHFSPEERFATGIRNTGGISFDASGRMFATQHGRDQLSQNWPQLYRPEQGPELPAEELIAPVQGADFGWPECYYDGLQKRLVLAPEYGGDGGKRLGPCAAKQTPVAAFPAHWAPNDVLIYKGGQFPASYAGGAFIAFHGSWNRAPAPQAGYNIVFQPLSDGRPSGNWIVFADGFAGAFKEPGRAEARPSGLAMAPDGALYISDDVHGRIWRVTYHGSKLAALRSASTADGMSAGKAAVVRAAAVKNSDGPFSPPPGFTREQIALGNRIFHGQARNGTCAGCHGSDARGTSVGPPLTGNGGWIWSDGSVKSLSALIAKGVPQPKRYAGGMPPKGGAALSTSDVNAVAAYVWVLAKNAGSGATTKRGN